MTKKWIDYSMVFLANVNQHDLQGKPSIALEKMSASTHQEGKSDDNNDSVPNDHNGEKFFDAHLQSNRCFVLVTAKVWKANGKGDPIFIIAEPSTFKKNEASGKMVHWMPKDGLAKINIKTRKHEDGYFQVMYSKYPESRYIFKSSYVSEIRKPPLRLGRFFSAVTLHSQL